MIGLLNELRDREQRGSVIRVVVTGAGLMARGVVRQVALTPGMHPAVIVNRTSEHAIEAWRAAGFDVADVVVSDDPTVLAEAVVTGRPAVTTSIVAACAVSSIDVVVEVTGAVEYGAEVALAAIDAGRHIVMMNAETDATVGCHLKTLADDAGVIYSNADGDQPAVLMRLIEFVDAAGFEIVAAMNCKGFMDVNATPDTIRPWAEKQGTSLAMTTAFTDGTKMNIENAVLANATGLIPEQRGMRGVQTDLAHALEACAAGRRRNGIVDYTLGGDFAGGVFVIGRSDDPTMVQPYMQYLKMGPGPEYLFYRPYHLCHIEVPRTIAEVALIGHPTIAPLGAPVVEVVAVAKCDLAPGARLDGIGGFTCYGEIDVASATRGLLPVGLADGAVVTRPLRRGEAVSLDAVEIDPTRLIARLHAAQNGARARDAAA